MTAYWDSLQRQIGAASERWRDFGEHGEAHFLLSVKFAEARAIRAVEAVTALPGFPDDLKDKIARTIAKAATPEALSYRLVTKSSDLIGDLHSIFHEIATRKIQTPFGVLSDDPEGTLKRLAGNGKDAFEDHLAECAECEALATLGNEAFCATGNAVEKQWKTVHVLMTGGVPPEDYPT